MPERLLNTGFFKVLYSNINFIRIFKWNYI